MLHVCVEFRLAWFFFFFERVKCFCFKQFSLCESIKKLFSLSFVISFFPLEESDDIIREMIFTHVHDKGLSRRGSGS